MRIIETPGTAGDLLDGWAEVTTTSSIAGTTIFRYRGPTGDSEAGVQISSTVGNTFVAPFDYTQGFLTGLSVVNQSAPDALSVTAVYRDEDGAIVYTESIPLARRGRQAFMVPAAVKGRRGTVELTGSGITVLGLRFNPTGSFTSVDPQRK